MSPHVFGVPAYLACQVLAGLLAIAITLRLSNAAGLPARRVFGALFVLLSAAIVGAVLTAPSFRPVGGLRYPGAGLAALAALPLARAVLGRGLTLLALGDLIAAPLAFGMAVGKFGCFLHGCCPGLPSHLPWAVAFPHRSIAWFRQLQAGLIGPAAEQSLPVHPLQLYCAVWLVCVGMLALSVRSRTKHAGQLFFLTLSLYAAGLFVSDRLTDPPALQVEVSALLILLFAAGALLVVTVRGRDARGVLPVTRT
jgi:prolipoprotein diacylglyceryltransferase